MTPPAKYRAVFFDADDTLFDYPKSERAALRACLREFKLQSDLGRVQASYRRHNLDMWRAFERGEVDQLGLRVERFRRLAVELELPELPVERVSAFYVEALSGESHLIPGALAVVRKLSKKFRLALVTNGIAAVQRRRFAASPLTPYFGAVIISEEVGLAKPDPRIFAPALRELEVTAGEVLYVGDSVTSDMAAARNAGMDFCWLNPSRLPVPDGQNPAYVIADIKELPGCRGL